MKAGLRDYEGRVSSIQCSMIYDEYHKKRKARDVLCTPCSVDYSTTSTIDILTLVLTQMARCCRSIVFTCTGSSFLQGNLSQCRQFNHGIRERGTDSSHYSAEEAATAFIQSGRSTKCLHTPSCLLLCHRPHRCSRLQCLGDFYGHADR